MQWDIYMVWGCVDVFKNIAFYRMIWQLCLFLLFQVFMFSWQTLDDSELAKIMLMIVVWF